MKGVLGAHWQMHRRRWLCLLSRWAVLKCVDGRAVGFLFAGGRSLCCGGKAANAAHTALADAQATLAVLVEQVGLQQETFVCAVCHHSVTQLMSVERPGPRGMHCKAHGQSSFCGCCAALLAAAAAASPPAAWF
jgi:hypothetical protein